MNSTSGNETGSGQHEGRPSVFYNLDALSDRRPGAVLAAGYGNPLKSVVRAANDAQVHPLFTTATDDKLRGFAFGGSTNPVSLGAKFNARLFENEYAILKAAEECEARTILCASNAKPSDLLAEECIRRGILLLVPLSGDKSMKLWERATTDVIGDDIELAASVLQPVTWRRCAHCGLTSDNREVVARGYRCPVCGQLSRLSSDERIALTFDEGSVEEWFSDVEETDALGFPGFDGIIEKARTRSGYEEGVRCGSARIKGIPVAFGVMEPSFIMGSMGHVVGERLARMFERAIEQGLPVVVFSASGGARMQEGLVSLMQMAKVSAAVQAHGDAGLLYVSVLTDPTTGGVTASFATLGDVMLAEPGANIGFAGRRVIQDTIKQALPDDFQTAEFALEHGLIDAIVERGSMRDALEQLLRLHGDGKRPTSYVDPSDGEGSQGVSGDGSEAAGSSQEEGQQPIVLPEAIQGIIGAETLPPSLDNIARGLADIGSTLGKSLTEQAGKAGLWWALRNKGVADAPYLKESQSQQGDPSNHAWASVQLARNVHRPTSRFYIDTMFDEFVELHGDRAYADDGAIIGGIGRLGDRVVTVVAEEKGSDLKDKIARNFGCPQPEGYRKAMRLMRQAEKFGRPIVCFVDTQGAFCGKEAEERGMGNAIAESLALMSRLTVPVVSVVLGEGGSGGALALAVANKVAMQENAVYSVLSPEGFASILWKDGSRAPEAAEVMKMSAQDALAMGIIEDIVPEGHAPAHENPEQAAAAVWLYVKGALDELSQMSPEALKQQRYDRFRKF